MVIGANSDVNSDVDFGGFSRYVSVLSVFCGSISCSPRTIKRQSSRCELWRNSTCASSLTAISSYRGIVIKLSICHSSPQSQCEGTSYNHSRKRTVQTTTAGHMLTRKRTKNYPRRHRYEAIKYNNRKFNLHIQVNIIVIKSPNIHRRAIVGKVKSTDPP